MAAGARRESSFLPLLLVATRASLMVLLRRLRAGDWGHVYIILS
jgi:hypothetical protein